jgi:hemerythrin-like domain-containing protein
MTTVDASDNSRRSFLRAGVALAGASLLGGSTIMAQEGSVGSGQPQQPTKEKRGKRAEHEAEKVSPGEDLMREHGALKRILLIYEEAERRLLAGGADLPPDPLRSSASLIRSFIEDYHEKLEEDFLFPRYRKANELVDLVEVLAVQHQAGRRLTDRVLEFATTATLKDEADRKQLAVVLRQFIRMYAPHEAREDTVLFPALHTILTPNEYDALGEDFESRESELFGADGFEAVVDRVAGIERQLGIHDLAQFTPTL